MCEQCICEAIHLGEVLPGWYLVQATKDGAKGEMKAGMYGLVQCNDPDFRFKTKPYPDPLRDLDPALLDKDDPRWDTGMTWCNKADKFGRELQGEPRACWRLVQAAIACGYDPDTSGYFDGWLFHRMGKMIQAPWIFPLPLNVEATLPEAGQPGAFGTQRSHSIHTGVDLYAPEGTSAVAVENGVVVRVETFTGPEVGTPWWLPTQAILVEGASGVVCYGELKVEHLKEGDPIERGMLLGDVTPVLPVDRGNGTSMLHLELYEKGYRGPTVTWEIGAPKPEGLLDPTSFLKEAYLG